MLRLGTCWPGVLAAVATYAVPTVHAQPAASTHANDCSVSDADCLFEQGRMLAKKGRFKEACECFAKSDALGRTFGTAANLGVCAERDGDTARAWQLYNDAARIADGDGVVDQANFARERAGSVSSKLCTVRVTMADPAAATTVRIRGHDVSPAAEIRELVAPGEVDIVVAGSRGVRMVRSVRCGAAGDSVTVKVPADLGQAVLASEPGAPAMASRGLIAEANVGMAAGDLIAAGWLPYVVVDAGAGVRVSERVAIGGRLTGLIAAAPVRVTLQDPDRVVSGGPMVGGFVGPAVQIAPIERLALGAGAGLGAVLSSPTGRRYAPAFQLGASYALSTAWQVSLGGIVMTRTAHVGTIVIASVGASLL